MPVRLLSTWERPLRTSSFDGAQDDRLAHVLEKSTSAVAWLWPGDKYPFGLWPFMSYRLLPIDNDHPARAERLRLEI